MYPIPGPTTLPVTGFGSLWLIVAVAVGIIIAGTILRLMPQRLIHGFMNLMSWLVGRTRLAQRR